MTTAAPPTTTTHTRMNRIDSIFASLRAAKRPALMPFLCGGYPSPNTLERALPAVERAGASIVEIGFPFSDPIADGPTIAAAMHEALLAGTTPQSIFDSVRRARASTNLGLVAMVSISIVQRLGIKQTVKLASAAGIDGFIFPDVPLEEAAELSGPVKDAGLTMSLLIAPTTPPHRTEKIVNLCSGFVYLLARVGITGESSSGEGIDVAGIRARIETLRSLTPLPLACGFGISTAEHVRAVVAPVDQGGAGADAAIVGSALVKRMGKAAAHSNDPVDEAESFVRALAMGLQ